MPAKSHILRDLALLLLLSYAAFWFNMGKLGLIDPDEPFYAQSCREMVQSGDWLTPQIFGQPQFEKPIFYYWLTSASFRTFGESEFSGRLPTAIASTLLVLLTYAVGLRLFGRRAGLIAGLFMASGLLLCVMGRLMLTDVPLALAITASLFCYWLALNEPGHRDRWIFWHLVWTGIAVLIKGPIGSMVPLLSTLTFSYFARRRWLVGSGAPGRGFWFGLAAYATIVAPWYALMLVKYGWRFFDEFFIRDNWLRLIRAEHPSNNHLWYYPGILLVGSIPWLPGLALAMRRMFRDARTDANTLFVVCFFVPNLILLTAAQSKLPSYGFFLFVPVALLIGQGLDSLISSGFRSRSEKWLVLGAAGFQAAMAVALPCLPTAGAFVIPTAIFALMLVVALFGLVLRRYPFWLATTALASVALIGCALILDSDAIEALSSSKPIARKMMKLQQPGEPLLASKMAVRGIHYYTREPVSVIATNAHPFWADHPLPVIAGLKGLEAFLAEHPTALCTMGASDWGKFSKAPGFQNGDSLLWIGNALVIRAKANPKPLP